MDFAQERLKRSPSCWTFEAHSLALVLELGGSPRHAIDLTKITSSTSMLDVIFDVSSRPWANQEIVGALVQELQELFDPQTNLRKEKEAQGFDPIDCLHKRRIN